MKRFAAFTCQKCDHLSVTSMDSSKGTPVRVSRPVPGTGRRDCVHSYWRVGRFVDPMNLMDMALRQILESPLSREAEELCLTILSWLDVTYRTQSIVEMPVRMINLRGHLSSDGIAVARVMAQMLAEDPDVSDRSRVFWRAAAIAARGPVV